MTRETAIETVEQLATSLQACACRVRELQASRHFKDADEAESILVDALDHIEGAQWDVKNLRQLLV